MPVDGAIAGRQASRPTQQQTSLRNRFYNAAGIEIRWNATVGVVHGSMAWLAMRSRIGGGTLRYGQCGGYPVSGGRSGHEPLWPLTGRELSVRGLKCVLVGRRSARRWDWMCFLAWVIEDGSRFGEISAPLGNIDGPSVLREQPIWMVVHCWHAIFENRKIRNRGSCKQCILALSQVRAWSYVDWGNGKDAGFDGTAQAIRITVARTDWYLALCAGQSESCRAHPTVQAENTMPNRKEREFLVGSATEGAERTRPCTSAIEEAADSSMRDITSGHQTGCQALQRTLGRAWTAQTQSYERESHRNVGGSHSGSVGRKEHQSWNSGHLATSHLSRASPTSR